jgi:hypothetical protein
MHDMTHSSLIASLNSITFGDDPHSALTVGIRLARHGKSVVQSSAFRITF